MWLGSNWGGQAQGERASRPFSDRPRGRDARNLSRCGEGVASASCRWAWVVTGGTPVPPAQTRSRLARRLRSNASYSGVCSLPGILTDNRECLGSSGKRK